MSKLFLSIFFLTCFAISGEPQDAKPSSQAPTKFAPCTNAMSQMEMTQCSGEEYRKADAHLNRIYSNLLNSIPSEAGKQDVKTIQKAWLHYRDLHCAAARSQFEGGSMAPMVFADCMRIVTNHRIEEIRAAYETGKLTLE